MNIISKIIHSIIAAGEFAIYEKEILVLESFFQGIQTVDKKGISAYFSTGLFDLKISRIGSSGSLVSRSNLKAFEFIERPEKANRQNLFFARVYDLDSEDKSPVVGVSIYFNIELRKYAFEVISSYCGQVETYGGSFINHGSSRKVFLIFQKELDKIAFEKEKRKKSGNYCKIKPLMERGALSILVK